MLRDKEESDYGGFDCIQSGREIYFWDVCEWAGNEKLWVILSKKWNRF